MFVLFKCFQAQDKEINHDQSTTATDCDGDNLDRVKCGVETTTITNNILNDVTTNSDHSTDFTTASDYDYEVYISFNLSMNKARPCLLA